MFYLMHCGGMPFNGGTITERSLGGSETAAYYVARGLAARGHRVTLFTNDPEGEGVYDDVKYVWAGKVSEQFPLGERFHMYATMTPVDVCLVQRSPFAFFSFWSSKVNLLWLHDLALGRTKGLYHKQMWNVDSILTVSDWHRQQVVDSWGVSERVVHSIENGVDQSLYVEDDEYVLTVPKKMGQKTLLYCSRPERGLENLVKPGGIMEQLWEEDQDYVLWVCGYDNVTPQMREMYEYLWGRIDQLPNAMNLGALTKRQLADVQLQADVLAYPTTFHDTSCIVAMEAMAAGLPFVSSEIAALPETCHDSGSVLVPLKDGEVDQEAFITAVRSAMGDEKLSALQRQAAHSHKWDAVVNRLEHVVANTMVRKRRNPYTMALHLRRNSDIMALRSYMDSLPDSQHRDALSWIGDELGTLYAFADSDEALAAHYNKYAAASQTKYVKQCLDDNSRFRSVLSKVAGHIAHAHGGMPGGKILDYGSQHGHYAINIARHLPNVHVDAVDVDESALAFGRKWADSALEGTSSSCAFHSANGFIDAARHGTYDVLLVAELLEHVPEPWALLNRLLPLVKPGGLVVLTTPFGPWEYEQYERESPWRFHLWHFERQDLVDMVGHMASYSVAVVYSKSSPHTGEALGSYITTFHVDDKRAKPLDQRVRLARSVPVVQSVSCCMIIGSAPNVVMRCLDSALPLADEFIIALDQDTIDSRTEYEVHAFADECPVPVKILYQESPTSIGFDEARNRTLRYACGDWILWLDADEYLHGGEKVRKLLRNNQYDAYAIKQHHFSLDPAGILKTDLPTKLFRNSEGIKFYGVVHEHPEKGVNKGAGHVQLLLDASIAHEAYLDESIRRDRFTRNVGLMVKDREKYPERKLGKFLWMRDLSHMIRYEMERTNGAITDEMRKQARQGIAMWEELVKDGEVRMIMDGMEYYDTLVGILGAEFRAGTVQGFSYGEPVKLAEEQVVESRFLNRRHYLMLQQAILDKRTEDYGKPFF